jgi:hypothetical protein
MQGKQPCQLNRYLGSDLASEVVVLKQIARRKFPFWIESLLDSTHLLKAAFPVEMLEQGFFCLSRVLIKRLGLLSYSTCS